MTDHEIDMLIKNAIENRSAFELFNIEFDETPAKISRATKKEFKRIKNTMFASPRPQRVRLRYLAAAIIGASVLTVGVGAYCSKYVFDKGDAEMEYITIQSSVDDKTSIEEVYEITYILDGYKLEYFEATEIDVDTIYYKGSSKVRLSQDVIGASDYLINTENAIIETIDINGGEAIYIDSSTEYDDSQMLIWTYDGYNFFLRANAKINNRDFGKEDLIDMAQTIQIKDN